MDAPRDLDASFMWKQAAAQYLCNLLLETSDGVCLETHQAQKN